MNALIRTTETSRNSINNVNPKRYRIEEAIKLLRQHMEEFVFRKQEVIVCIASNGIECRNAIQIMDYEFDVNYLYLNDGNYELHIKFDKDIQVVYNDFEESFTIMIEDEEIIFYFLQ